jgi:hypothetical protein
MWQRVKDIRKTNAIISKENSKAGNYITERKYRPYGQTYDRPERKLPFRWFLSSEDSLTTFLNQGV